MKKSSLLHSLRKRFRVRWLAEGHIVCDMAETGAEAKMTGLSTTYSLVIGLNREKLKLRGDVNIPRKSLEAKHKASKEQNFPSHTRM